MALVEVQNARVVHASKPFGQDWAGVLWSEAEMTFGNGDGMFGFGTFERVFQFEELFLDAEREQFHKFLPRALGVGLIAIAAKKSVPPGGLLIHHVDSDISKRLACALNEVGGPTAVAPADEFERIIALAHFTREVDGCCNRIVFFEAGVAVGSFVAKLPKFDVERFGVAVSFAFAVIWIVGVGNPVGGFLSIAGAITFARLGVAFLAVAHEVDAVKRFGADT